MREEQLFSAQCKSQKTLQRVDEADLKQTAGVPETGVGKRGEREHGVGAAESSSRGEERGGGWEAKESPTTGY